MFRFKTDKYGNISKANLPQEESSKITAHYLKIKQYTASSQQSKTG
jgi:hypothetical protein